MKMPGNLMSISAGLILYIFSQQLAQAACSQPEMEGTWYTYSMSVDSYAVYASRTNRCKIKLNSTGSIVASKSSCRLRDYSGVFTVPVAGGNIKVKSTCSLNGNIKLITPDGISTVVMDYGTAAKDKQAFSVVGYDNNNPDFITHLNAVKR